MSFDTCVDAIKKAAGEEGITDKEMRDLLDHIEQVKGRVENRNTPGYQEAARIAAEEKLAQAQQKKLATVRTLTARVARRGQIDAYETPDRGISAMMRRVNTPLNGSHFSAEAEMRAQAKTWHAGLVNDLDHAGLLDIVKGRAIERDWLKELGELSKTRAGGEGKPGVTGNKQALDIAKIIDRYQAASVARVNRFNGERINNYFDYATRTSHSPAKIFKAGFQKWLADITPKLDMDRTLAGADNSETFFKRIYNELITGVHVTVRDTEGRVLHFRDTDSWADYNKQYGNDHPFATIMQQLGHAARTSAVMSRWGTNPKAEFNRDLEYYKLRAIDNNPDQAHRLHSKEGFLRKTFETLDGTANQPMNLLGARVSSYVRLSQSLAKLGGVAITHLGSIPTKAGELHYNGATFLEGYSDALKSAIRGRGTGETREIMDLLAAGAEGMHGDILSRFDYDDGLPGVTSAAANTFFKWSGLSYLLNAQKAGTSFTISRLLGSQMDREFEDVNPRMQRMMTNYGISKQDWDGLRSVEDHPEIDGRKFLVPGAAGKITRLDNNASQDLALKLHAMFSDIADRSIVTPGVLEKTILTQGQHPGTVLGEALRFIAQFKQWPIAAINQNVLREFSGQTAAQTAVGVTHMAVASTAAGYLAMTLKDLAKGRTPRDPQDPKTWEAAFTQGGGAGILGDFLFGQYSRLGQNFGETLLGPVLGTGAALVFDTYNRMKTKAEDEVDGKQNNQKIGPTLLRGVMDNAPFVNLFYVREALNYLFLNQVQDWMAPGSTARYERNVKSQQGQSFWLSPTNQAFGDH